MPDFLDTQTAAEWLKLDHKTLATWRYQGRGPRYYKFGRVVRYSADDLHKFIEESARCASQGGGA